MIRMEYIQEFVKLARCLSFTQTADELFITQPSLSRHLAAMEEELQLRLIERSTRQVKLTPEGEQLLPYFEASLNTFRTAMEKAGSIREGSTGVLRVCNPRHFMESWVEDRVCRFREKNPGVKVEVKYCSVEEGFGLVRDGDADVTVGIRSPSGVAGLSSRWTRDERLSVLVSCEDPLASKGNTSLAALAGRKFVQLERKGSVGMIVPLMESIGLRARDFIYVDTAEQVALAVKQSGGVCVELSRSGNLGRDYLRAVPLSDPQCQVPVCFYCRVGGSGTAAESFMESCAG